jgi:hypothetical protein
MNKSELIKALSDETNISFDDATLVVNIFIDSMKKSLLDGDRIEIRGRKFQNQKLWRLSWTKSKNRRKRFRYSQAFAVFQSRQGAERIYQ